MANNYTLFSIEVGLTRKEYDWLKKKLDEADDYDFSYEFDDDKSVTFYSEESGNPDQVADLLQEFLKEYRPEGYFAFEVAHTCDVPRPGEFGGAACFITAKRQKWMPTSTWLVKQEEAFKKRLSRKK